MGRQITVALVLLGVVLTACASDPVVTPSPEQSQLVLATPTSPVVASEFEGYVVDASTTLSPISVDQLRVAHGAVVQGALTSEPSLKCGDRATLVAGTAAGVSRVERRGEADVFRPSQPVSVTLVKAQCAGGSALLIIDQALGTVLAFEVATALPAQP